MPPKVIVVAGPTATGKTRLGIELAAACGGEIVSADSMQVYTHMDIGTAKPTPADRRGVLHHMIDVASPFEDYSVARYVSEVDRRLIAEGLPPSWEDRVRPEDTRPGSMADSPDRGDGANDARLLANVPPHAQARA